MLCDFNIRFLRSLQPEMLRNVKILRRKPAVFSSLLVTHLWDKTLTSFLPPLHSKFFLQILSMVSYYQQLW